MSRSFQATDAVRSDVPLLVGLMGPSGGGKTYSALSIATGIQSVVGGDIYGVDTEAKRMLHYADQFKFKHVEFGAPFGSLDYLECLKWCVSQGAKVIVVDSLSHEHSGPGGYLDLQDQEMKRLAGDDYGTWKADRFKMLAWAKPSANRRRFIDGLLQLPASFVFCFRAKEKVKMEKNDRGKQDIKEQGWMPIAGEEFVFEMTACALLPPAARGVPRWKAEFDGERSMMKLPSQFMGLLDNGKPLSAEHGKAMALWARGGTKAAAPAPRAAEPAPVEPTTDDAAEPFQFTVWTAKGVKTGTDGAKWSQFVIAELDRLSFDKAEEFYAKNLANFLDARTHGHGALVDAIDAAWKVRNDDANADTFA